MSGDSEILLGNAAIVRGALEAGVAFATGYPGTPSSEVTDGFARVAAERGITFEYAVNEKIALELAFAASLAGSRSICAMKHLGLMVAGDPLSTIPYVGIDAGMLIVSASDPGCRTSPNEHDQRYLGPMLKLPILEPATVSDAYGLTRFGFTLSEKSELPVLLRVTTRVAHSRARVVVGPLAEPRRGKFVRAPERRVPMPENACRMRLELAERIERARALLAEANILSSRGGGDVTVVAIGAPAATTADVLDAHGLADRVRLWTLRASYPLPERELAEILASTDRLLVLEELSPYLEDSLLALAQRRGLGVRVLGKRSGHVPEPFEISPEIIERALAEALGLGIERRNPAISLPVVPARSPSLCPGCPHRAAFFAARAAFGPDPLFFNDIGCYTLGYGPPLNAADALLCMGAGFSLATGVSRASGTRSVGFMGDSTFFHAGMPALLEAIKEEADVVLIVLDNGVTAMTGFQESPTTPGASRASIVDVARALGAERVERVDPWDVAATTAAFERAAHEHGPTVIVVSRACPVYEARATHEPPRPAVTVDRARCRSCGREPAGMRCSLPLSEGYERHLARARATRRQRTPTPAVAPCAERCPLYLCVQGYAGHIAAGEPAEAARHVIERTPLAETVCRVCDRPCETACVRSRLDEPVAVNDLKRFAVEWAREHAPELLQIEPKAAPNGRPIAVVGAGPSGLAAAQELVVRGFSVTLFDARARPGGLLAHAIPEHRLPASALERDLARMIEAGVELRMNQRLGRDVTLDQLLADYEAVYLALGAGGPRELALESEPGAPPLLGALGYLERVRSGKAERLGRVAVIGGGNAAIDAARTALRMGAPSVVVACIEGREEMPALRDEILAAETEGIQIVTAVRPVRATRSGLLVQSTVRGGSLHELPADHVLIAIGQSSDRSFLDNGSTTLVLDADGRVVVDPDTCETSHPRVFAGGDGAGSERTVTSAIAAGLRAAWGIARTLIGQELADRRLPPPIPPRKLARFDVRAPRAPRRRPPELSPARRIAQTDEVIGTFDEAAAREEARRCLACGLCGNCRACIDTLACPALMMEHDRIVVDAGLCMGCNVCVSTCSNTALLPGAAR